ncbi:MAG: hypothetical protein IPJ77_23810 [Planctomycetes bacterium]|nr:hypothetical protein [Planctomycetota bacterium]
MLLVQRISSSASSSHSEERGLAWLLARVALLALSFVVAAAPLALAQGAKRSAAQKPAARAATENVDPYTRGKREALDKAGYVAIGEFPLTQGLHTRDVEEALGNVPMRWVETEHFRIGSTLTTYGFQSDPQEERRLKDDLAQLKSRFERFSPPERKLDPWLRVHLAAWRVERLYADLLKRFGLVDEEFDPERTPERPPGIGTGRYLGMEHKFVVLLFEQDASLGRFCRRIGWAELQIYGRWRLPGGAMGIALSAEGVRGMNFDLDAALTSFLLGETAVMLLEGLNENLAAVPIWFRYGVSHAYAREFDPRWTLTATGTTREFGDDSWKWEPRVGRLVANDAACAWKAMSAWISTDQIRPQEHLVMWSRTSWLLKRKPSELRTFLLGVAQPLPGVPEAQRIELIDARTRESCSKAFGRTLEELDAEWRAWVAKTYPK